MTFPMSFWDLCLFLFVISFILLVTLELISSYLGKKALLISMKKFKNAAISVFIVFLVAIILRVITSLGLI